MEWSGWCLGHLTLTKEPLVPTGHEAGRARVLIQTVWRKEVSVASARNCTPDCLLASP
jgi:hypothetical protein